jgi:hypothetical protein
MRMQSFLTTESRQWKLMVFDETMAGIDDFQLTRTRFDDRNPGDAPKTHEERAYPQGASPAECTKTSLF